MSLKFNIKSLGFGCKLLRSLLLFFFRPPPRSDLHWPCLWLHHRLHHAAVLRWLWQVIQRWGENREAQKDTKSSPFDGYFEKSWRTLECCCQWPRWPLSLFKCEKCHVHFPQHWLYKQGCWHSRGDLLSYSCTSAVGIMPYALTVSLFVHCFSFSTLQKWLSTLRELRQWKWETAN